MGSLSTEMPRGMTPEEFFEARSYFEGENDGHSWKTVAKSKVGNVFYMVTDETNKETGVVERRLYLIKFSIERGEICWKTIGEEAGPVDAECPAKLLKLMGPPSNDYAREWREKCEANAAYKNEKTKLNRLVQDGDVLVLKRPINLVDGGTFTQIEVIDWKRKLFKVGHVRGRLSAIQLNRYGWSIRRVDEEEKAKAKAARSVRADESVGVNGELFTKDPNYCVEATW